MRQTKREKQQKALLMWEGDLTRHREALAFHEVRLENKALTTEAREMHVRQAEISRKRIERKLSDIQILKKKLEA